LGTSFSLKNKRNGSFSKLLLWSLDSTKRYILDNTGLKPLGGYKCSGSFLKRKRIYEEGEFEAQMLNLPQKPIKSNLAPISTFALFHKYNVACRFCLLSNSYIKVKNTLPPFIVSVADK
jgi:hypothetical protein